MGTDVDQAWDDKLAARIDRFGSVARKGRRCPWVNIARTGERQTPLRGGVQFVKDFSG
jgi:hypothetical protein